MKNQSYLSFISLVFFVVFLSACSQPEKSSGQENVKLEEDINPSGELREIFYNMYLPDEMSRLFERVGANYDPDIANSPENFSRYSGETKIAVALGIYGVDLSYARLFDQKSATANYLSTIKILTGKLNIPSSYFGDIYSRLENHISVRDSVAKITNELYSTTDEFLKQNEKDTLATLIVYGGWIEALYIASKILEFNSNNIEIMNRIAEQKYSLNSLLSLMSNYQNNIFVTENLLLLKRLKKSFDRFEIYYDKDDFELDTLNKTISSRKYESGMNPEIASEINHIVSEIRTILIL